MRIRLLISALLLALAWPAAVPAAEPSGYCAQPPLAVVEGTISAPDRAVRPAEAEDPLFAVVPVVQYACSNSCRRNCYRASQSCRASRHTCQRRLSACIRSCGC
jgi:hypothetical protein